MNQEDVTRNILELREFEASAKEQFKTLFNRVDKQDELIESMRSLNATVGGVVESQKRVEANVKAVREDVDELKSKPGKSYDKIKWTVVTAIASGAAGYLLSAVLAALKG